MDPIAASKPGIVYLDNAATSYPKPPSVAEAMARWLQEVGGSPGRSGHRMSTESARVVFEAREALARLLGAPDSRRVVFTKNATEAINIGLEGLLTRGDHVVTTSVEHNSMMRPLRHLAATGRIELTTVPCSPLGLPDPDDVVTALRPSTRMVALLHASNVTGALLPVSEVAARLKERGVLLLVDAAQTAGAVPIDVVSLGADVLAFTGHKSLLGPPGTGGLWLREGVEPSPLLRGGTGSDSEREEQPDFLPDRLEAGTLNGVGIAGLLAGVEYVLKRGVETIREHEVRITGLLLAGLRRIPGVRVLGPREARERVAVLPVTLDGLAPSEVGFLLDEGWGIMTRVGLQCAPAAHRTIGTFPGGTVRLSPGPFTTEADVDRTLEAFRELARGRGAA